MQDGNNEKPRCSGHTCSRHLASYAASLPTMLNPVFKTEKNMKTKKRALFSLCSHFAGIRSWKRPISAPIPSFMLNETSWGSSMPAADELRFRTLPHEHELMIREDSGDDWHVLDDDDFECSSRAASSSSSYQDSLSNAPAAAATVFVKQVHGICYDCAGFH